MPEPRQEWTCDEEENDNPGCALCGEPAATECFACGLPVCGDCGDYQTSFDGEPRVICGNCERDDEGRLPPPRAARDGGAT